jgi:hypothetical protein
LDNETAAPFLGLSLADRTALALQNPPQFGGDLDELDDAGTYFDLGLRQVTANGIYHYVSTRNNNFSNRDQKAQIVVSDRFTFFQALGWNGGQITAVPGMQLTAALGALSALTTFAIVTHPPDTESSLDEEVASNYIEISPLVLPMAADQSLELAIEYPWKPLLITDVHYSQTLDGEWSTRDAEISGGTATLSITEGGVYVVSASLSWGAVVGIVLGVVAFLAGMVGLFYWKYRSPATGGKELKSPTPSGPNQA